MEHIKDLADFLEGHSLEEIKEALLERRRSGVGKTAATGALVGLALTGAAALNRKSRGMERDRKNRKKKMKKVRSFRRRKS